MSKMLPKGSGVRRGRSTGSLDLNHGDMPMPTSGNRSGRGMGRGHVGDCLEHGSKREQEGPELTLIEPLGAESSEDEGPRGVVNTTVTFNGVLWEYLKKKPLESFDGVEMQGEQVKACLCSLDEYFFYVPLDEFHKAQYASFLLSRPAKLWWAIEMRLNRWTRE